MSSSRYLNINKFIFEKNSDLSPIPLLLIVSFEYYIKYNMDYWEH